MSISARSPYEDPESSTSRWVVIFVLLSILAHLLIAIAIVLITHFMPVPKIIVPPAVEPKVTLSLMAPPSTTPKKKPIFIPTTPDAQAQHKEEPIESANDTDLKSKSKTARAPDSIMPDVMGKEHNPNLNDSPNVSSQESPQVSSTPPTPRQAQPQKPTPPQPTPQKAREPSPPQPTPKPTPPTPQKKGPPEVDENGFPVLPPIDAPTMAPPNTASQPLAPAAALPEQATSVHGALGRSGDNSPAAMATELGKYKQYVYSVVGSYWYPDVDKSFQLLPVGMVHIQFTIHSDGTLTDVIVLEGNTASLEQLLTISKHALIAPAPYKPFSDAMIKEVGDSYTDDFTFSVY